nr:polyprenol phosphomannose-dependent alpha 1,6 mannosyltransferase MptB [Propionicimonas sp.]
MAVTQQTRPAGSRRALWHARAAAWREDVSRAWQHRPVRRGLLGSALLFAGSLTPAYLPQNSPWWEPMRALGLDNWWAESLGTALVVAGVALLVEAWFKLRPSLYHEVKHWPITLLWSLPLLLAPPIFSHDAYAYAAEGWLLRNGLNPYTNPISVLPGPFADQAAWLWRYTTAMYPPLSLEMFHGLVVLAGNNPYYSAVAMRIPALVGVGLIAYFLPRIAQRMGADVQMTAWFSVVNPLVIIDFVGGAHNDALMMGLVVLALWLAFEGKFWWAAVVVGIGACIKQPAILAFYPVALIGHPWRTFRWRDTSGALLRLVLSLAVAVATFVAISLVTGLGFGWVNAADVPGKVVTLAPFTLVGAGLKYALEFFGQPAAGQVAMDALRYLGLALTVVGIGWLGLTVGRRRPVTFLSWSYLIFAFGGIALNSWYLTWGGLLLPLTKPNERITGTAVAVTTVLLAYGAGNLAWRNDAVALGFAGLAVILVMLYRHAQERKVHLAAANGEGNG